MGLGMWKLGGERRTNCTSNSEDQVGREGELGRPCKSKFRGNKNKGMWQRDSCQMSATAARISALSRENVPMLFKNKQTAGSK